MRCELCFSLGHISCDFSRHGVTGEVNYKKYILPEERRKPLHCRRVSVGLTVNHETSSKVNR